MTKTTLSTPTSPPTRPASQQDQPNSGQDDDNQSVSSQRIRKRDKFLNMFRSTSSNPKATNSHCTSFKSTVNDDSTVSTEGFTHRLSTVGIPQTVNIDHVVSSTTVRSTPSDVQLSSSLTRPHLDVFAQNVRAPAVRITLPKFWARIETTPQLALCIGLLSKA
ncbi:hypothetical protein BGZ96_010942, partial [Linnemannia gamsii]